MIKFAATGDKGVLIGLGLSRKNINLLMKKKAIRFELEPLGLPPGVCLIFFGETEKEMAEKLRPYLHNKTKITFEGLQKIVVSTMSALALVMLQPLVIPWLGQWLLERGF